MQLPREGFETFAWSLIQRLLCPWGSLSEQKCANLWLRIFQQGRVNSADAEFMEIPDKNLSSIRKTWIWKSIFWHYLILPILVYLHNKNKSWAIFLQWSIEGMGGQADQIDLIFLNFSDTGRRILGKAEIPSITLLLCHGIAAHSSCSEPCAMQKNPGLS